MPLLMRWCIGISTMNGVPRSAFMGGSRIWQTSALLWMTTTSTAMQIWGGDIFWDFRRGSDERSCTAFALRWEGVFLPRGAAFVFSRRSHMRNFVNAAGFDIAYKFCLYGEIRASKEICREGGRGVNACERRRHDNRGVGRRHEYGGAGCA